ncbi:MAG: YqaE/Pmp3 family membrane protein [Myxococcota bacterium]
MSLLFSYFAPPIGVFLTRGVSMRLLVNVMLTILCVVPATFTIFLAPLGLLPAIIHAVWEIATDVDEA